MSEEEILELETPNPKPRKEVNPYLLVIFSFIVVILVGSLLLYLPIARIDKVWGNWEYYIDCLFTAVSCTCVTGLSTLKTGLLGTYNFFGQLVCMLMIMIGGLGFITVLSFFITLVRRKIKFSHKFLIAQAVGSTSFGGVIKFVRNIIIIHASLEIIGAVLFFPVFRLTTDNLNLQIWRSIFHSVSTFNNAGFDIMGTTSLIRDGTSWASALPSWAYYYLLAVTMLLIVMGGLSFLVYMDILSFKRFRQYRVFTKIALLMTAILLVSGFALIALFECTKQNNAMNVIEAMFQAVTTRTAGFAATDQSKMSVGGKIVTCVLMFIGGNPLSTAGGIKTTTIFLVALALFSYVTGRKINAFKRTYSESMVVKAMSLLAVSIVVIIICFGAISAIEANNDGVYQALGVEAFDALFFECISAFGTVGLSQGITPDLVWGSKLFLMILMFLGRLGPMTMFQVFQINMNKKSKLHYSYVEEDFLIG